MAAHIDGEALVVRDGDREWPFTLDIMAGTAVLDPDGIARRIWLLRWGEKCALARFAGVGSAFVEARLLDLCAPGHDVRHRNALIALILWLHAPDGRALPLDTALLARVTRSLCPALGIGPEALMAMSAPDVEALWQDEDRPQRSAPQRDDVTRIRIEPDPATHDGVGAPAMAEQGVSAENAQIASVTGMSDSLAQPGTARRAFSAGEDAPIDLDRSSGTDGGIASNATMQRAMPVLPRGDEERAPSTMSARSRWVADHAALRFRLMDSALMDSASPPARSDNDGGSQPKAAPVSVEPGIRDGAPLSSRATIRPAVRIDPVVQSPGARLPNRQGPVEAAALSMTDGSVQPSSPQPRIDARLDGLVALVTRPAPSLDLPETEPGEQLVEALASELSDAAAALGIAVG